MNVKELIHALEEGLTRGTFKLTDAVLDAAMFEVDGVRAEETYDGRETFVVLGSQEYDEATI